MPRRRSRYPNLVGHEERTDVTYQLIALDMDGTLLDSRKHVLPSSTAAIDRALDAGRHVAICSGRCPAMVEVSRAELGRISYAICGSGTSLYSLDEQRLLWETHLSHDVLTRILEVCEGEDCLFEPFTGTSFYYERDALERMPGLGLGVYVEAYRASGRRAEDMRALLCDPASRIQKLNVHFCSTAARAHVRELVSGLGVGLVDFEEASLEFSPVNANKGTGLLALADLLGIPREATIAVGDADNDLPMLEAAGLGVAMGNANPRVLAAADARVADNDHDGVAEAISRFLLADAEEVTQ